MAFRQTQIDLLKNNPELEMGKASSLNLTVLQGGNQINVVPPTIYATFDMRLTVAVNLKEFESQVIF